MLQLSCSFAVSCLIFNAVSRVLRYMLPSILIRVDDVASWQHMRVCVFVVCTLANSSIPCEHLSGDMEQEKNTE